MRIHGRLLTSAAKVLLLAVAVSSGLTSCRWYVNMLGVPTDCERFTSVVPFDDSERILRGTWTGVVSDHPSPGGESALTLELTAHYQGEDGYDVEGAFVLGSDPEGTIEGTVRGGCTERYAAATGARTEPASVPPPASFEAEARDEANAVAWSLRGRWYAMEIDEEGRPTVPLLLTRPDGHSEGPFETEVAITRVAGP